MRTLTLNSLVTFRREVGHAEGRAKALAARISALRTESLNSPRAYVGDLHSIAKIQEALDSIENAMRHMAGRRRGPQPQPNYGAFHGQQSP